MYIFWQKQEAKLIQRVRTKLYWSKTRISCVSSDSDLNHGCAGRGLFFDTFSQWQLSSIDPKQWKFPNVEAKLFHPKPTPTLSQIHNHYEIRKDTFRLASDACMKNEKFIFLTHESLWISKWFAKLGARVHLNIFFFATIRLE